MHCFHIFVQVNTPEQTFFNVLILGKSRFPLKSFITSTISFPSKRYPNLFGVPEMKITRSGNGDKREGGVTHPWLPLVV